MLNPLKQNVNGFFYYFQNFIGHYEHPITICWAKERKFAFPATFDPGIRRLCFEIDIFLTYDRSRSAK
jgi:hypothetical protein